jgi:hypothetical protein
LTKKGDSLYLSNYPYNNHSLYNISLSLVEIGEDRRGMRTSNIPPLFNHVFFFFLLSIGSSSSWPRGSSHHTYNHHGTTQYWKGDVKNVAVQSVHVQYISIIVCWASISSWKSEKKKKKLLLCNWINRYNASGSDSHRVAVCTRNTCADLLLILVA